MHHWGPDFYKKKAPQQSFKKPEPVAEPAGASYPYQSTFAQPTQPAALTAFNPGDPLSIPGYPDGMYNFGGWSGQHAYYIAVATGRSVWSTELPPPVIRNSYDPKMTGAAIAAAATQKRYAEQAQHAQWHDQQNYWGAQAAYDPYAAQHYGGYAQPAPAPAAYQAPTAATLEARKRLAERAAGVVDPNAPPGTGDTSVGSLWDFLNK
eukprot:CAMPEP_0177712724 /NCGR_PEP_ID=MMETSP0484_2-20121128/12553_1 /TAXON_ID=354590 /ORGANISM="Rhodomonas lens, Strain RHODO" /LENGTH=206 /DNA_ID=CAMNT_0019224555 /DNA_START=76 /DNA_END=693 /DNA_ORIENTATION=+